MNWQRSCLLACCLSLAAHAGAVDPGKDPVPSVMWAFYHKQMLGEAPFVFDERVKVLAPPFAEDARQVPLEIDARAFKGEVVRILAWAELNPLPKIVDFQPLSGVLPWLSISIPYQTAPPLRGEGSGCRKRAGRRANYWLLGPEGRRARPRRFSFEL